MIEARYFTDALLSKEIVVKTHLLLSVVTHIYTNFDLFILRDDSNCIHLHYWTPFSIYSLL